MIFKGSLVRMVCWTGLLVWVLGPLALAQAPCDPVQGNPTACENSLPGNDPSQWEVSGSGDPTIQGFATSYSVNLGQQVRFKVDTTAAAWRLDIYRLGYYAGKGARFIATVNPSPAGSYVQPPCTQDPTTGLIDCGNWSESALWAVPANAVSGVYIARAVRTDNGGASHIIFVVRDDSGNSDILFRTSDTTWQAYNDYGGTSLYVGGPVGRGYKVSYNRPFITRGGSRAPFVSDGYGLPSDSLARGQRLRRELHGGRRYRAPRGRAPGAQVPDLPRPRRVLVQRGARRLQERPRCWG